MRRTDKPRPPCFVIDPGVVARMEANTIKGDGCWLWAHKRSPGSTNYGTMHLNTVRDGRPHQLSVGAHVAAWEIANGRAVPPRMVVMHHCDVRSCVNPAHLSAATNSENIRDAIAKGRHGGRRRVTP